MVQVVAALIWRDNRFMICQRPEYKARGLLWEFVGGKVEPGETKARPLPGNAGRSWTCRWRSERSSARSITSTRT